MSKIFGFNDKGNGSYICGVTKAVGVPVSAPFRRTEKGLAAGFNTVTSEIDFGNITELNSTDVFSMSFGFKINNIGATQYYFSKYVNDNTRIAIATVADILYLIVANGDNRYGSFNYSTICKLNKYYHFTVLYDGNGAGDSDKLKLFIDVVL